MREDAARLLGEVRDAASARVAALDEARSESRARADQVQAEAGALRAERDRLAAELQAAQLQIAGGRAGPGIMQHSRSRARRRTGGGEAPTKRDRMIALAGGRHDLAVLPLEAVSKVANELAAEIGYSAGTARRELLSHVRQLRSTAGSGTAAPAETAEGGIEDAAGTEDS